MKQVPTFPGVTVNENGGVWLNGKALTQSRHRDGHLFVRFPVEGKRKCVYVHRLVCEAYHGPRPDKHECRHLDGDPGNNRPENLAWGTHKDNIRDRIGHGTSNPGSKAAASVLTEDMVCAARLRRASGEKIAAIARDLGVNRRTLRNAVSGVTWKTAKVDAMPVDGAPRPWKRRSGRYVTPANLAALPQLHEQNDNRGDKATS